MKPTIGTLGVAVVILLEACHGGSNSPTSPGPVVRNTNVLASEPFAFNLDGAGRLRVRLEGINGSVLVNGGPTGGVVAITGVREVRSDSRQDAEAHLAQLQVDVQDAGTDIVVRTTQPQASEGRNYVVNYQLRIPASIGLGITNVNGSLDVLGMTGVVTASLTNGRAEASVRVPAGGSVSLTTINGEIVVHLPSDTSAVFSAQVGNGSITLTDLVLQNEVRTSTSLRGTLGTGNGTVSLRTTNGAIRVDGTS